MSAAYESNQHIALLLGAPIAGVLVSWLGASQVLWLDAASFAVSATAVAVAVPSLSRRGSEVARGRHRDELAAGLRFLRQDRLLLSLAGGLALTNLLSAPFFTVIMPVYARNVLGSAAGLGVLTGALGAGSLGGAILYGIAGRRLPRRALWLLGFLVVPLHLWVLLIEPPLWTIALAFALTGLAAGPLNPLLVTVRMERIPEALRGRVSAPSQPSPTCFSPRACSPAGTSSAGWACAPAS